jgi:long-chain acyl-CoA synthetase
MEANRATRAELARSLEALMDNTNAKLAAHERLKFLVLVDSKWTIAGGFITPTMKLKRTALEAKYSPLISEWISRGTKLIWHLESR